MTPDQYLGPEALNLTSLIGGILVAATLSEFFKFLATSRDNRPPLTEEEQKAAEKLNAKKVNEHIKLFGSFCNTVGAAVVGAAFIIPYIGNHTWPDQDKLWWIGAGLALPIAGHIALRFLKSEG